MTDEDVDRDPETEASIQQRREFLAELAEGYRRAKEEADDSGWHDVLEPTEHPSRTEPMPLWEVIDTRASHTRRFDDENYWAVGLKSEKRSRRRKSEAEEPMDNYTYFYTNVDPSETPPEELASDFRRRWGIETGFRVIKEEFLSKSASPDSKIRTFYFNFAAHLYNLWTAANIRRAEELNADLSEGKQFTAGRLMQAIEDDPYDLNIPDEPSESRAVQSQLFF